ncbi:hypothetical protein DNX69_09065 [Rhodopseudomonas palustris]|uniref:Uncharacterized protein n=1 Tax=Rhodopseudomonas palustris TaxID=1076 RepID=A0A323UM89_RHOPL|nr:hypothetical protein [Rhodopseudomonas palustris]PZA12156.1 hypothetical protein DNX69_09065 [Rhodopseudomonas palustris]
MTGASVSALAALAGSAIGGLATLSTTWLSQNYQARSARLTQEGSRREKLFGEFIDQASKLYIDALMHSLDDPTKLIEIYALIGKLRLFAAPKTVAEAERVIEHIVALYDRPPLNLQDLHMLDRDKFDLLWPFAEACRTELTSGPS